MATTPVMFKMTSRSVNQQCMILCALDRMEHCEYRCRQQVPDRNERDDDELTLVNELRIGD